MSEQSVKSPIQKSSLNYKQPDRISEDEVALVRSHFKDNDALLNVLKKILLPSYADPSTPFEMTGADAFNMGRDWTSMPVEEVKALVVARQDTINWIGGALTWLKMKASESGETPEELALRRKNDSTK